MTKEEEIDKAKKYIAETLIDVIESINYKLSMETDLTFEEIEQIIEDMWR
jgi:hypothetical protein